MIKKIKHILVADDDPIYRDVAQAALEKSGHIISVAADGGEAIARLENESFDAAIIDLTMPVADGVTVIQTLRNSVLNATIPVIVITGHDDASAVERAYMAGATSFLTKPLNWLLFTPHIDFVLRTGQIENDLREASATAAFLSDLKSEMMAALAKEFQSPIKTIFGFSELIQKEVYGPLMPHAYKDMMADISKSAQSLNAALLKVMDFGNTLSESLQIKSEAVKARDAVLDAIAALEPQASRRDIRIVSDIRIEADAIISADRALLNQALRSIIENAVRLSPRGSEVRLSASFGDDGEMVVSIDDQGPPMPQDLLLEVNGRPRAPAFSTQPVSSDVSIKIAKILTEAHQGKLTIRSDESLGNVVRLTIPKVRRPAAQAPVIELMGGTASQQRLQKVGAELLQDPRLREKLTGSQNPFRSSVVPTGRIANST